MMLHLWDLPEYYRWSTDKVEGEAPELSLILAPGVAEKLRPVDQTHHVVAGYFRSAKLESFMGDITANDAPYGFESAGHVVQSPTGQTIITFPLAQVEFDLGQCESCGGSGEDEDFGMACFGCHGDKRKSEFRKKGELAVATTISVLHNLLEFFYHDGIDDLKATAPYQLAIYRSCVIMDDRWAAPLDGSLGSHVAKWLEEIGPCEFPAAVAKMRRAYAQSMPLYMERHGGMSKFSAWVPGSSRLLIDCPGNACGLHPSSMGLGSDRGGYEFSCHNLDSTTQQICLLVGMAAVLDLAREQGVGQE